MNNIIKGSPSLGALGLPVLAIGAICGLISYIGRKSTVDEPSETVKNFYIENSTVKSAKTDASKPVETVQKSYIEKQTVQDKNLDKEAIRKVMSELGKRSAEKRKKSKSI
jgi:hypothetical protein